MTGIGIDTGGTYTDAVIYDTDSQEIKASAKALTTREDLKKGIFRVLRKLPKEEIGKAEMLALSTTLATNACVENKGGRARLIFIGVSEKTVEEMGKNYGIESTEDIYFLNCIISNEEDQTGEADWEKFRRDVPEIVKGCEGISIVQLFSKKYGGNYEKKARAVIREFFNGPIVLGKDLFSDLNAIKRGAGALLNARLISVIHDFLSAVKVVFRECGAEIPPVIVRSDGTLMNEEMAEERPVETLLCGPAASIIGAMYLAQEENALVVDMGGTTTDVAVIERGNAKKVSDGISIGNWKTFVKGLFVDTFGLGGDTAVHYDSAGRLYLENYRVVPVSNLAQKYPQVRAKLQQLLDEDKKDNFYLHEFLILIKDPGEEGEYSPQERRLCNALKNGPLMLQEAAEAAGKDLYNFRTERLEQEGIIIRAGLTPTDAMAIKKDYCQLDGEAAFLAARYMEMVTGIPAEDFAEAVYELVKKRLYCNLVRILLQNNEEVFRGQEPDAQLENLIALSYDKKAGRFSDGESKLFLDFQTSYVLVGVGAPTHIFLEPVAEMLGTKAVIPPHAAVANAVGAVVGNVTVVEAAEICPVYTTAGIDCYQVLFSGEQKKFKEYEDARAYLQEETVRIAKEEACRRGAEGELVVETSCRREEATVDSNALLLSEKYEIIVRGKVKQDTIE